MAKRAKAAQLQAPKRQLKMPGTDPRSEPLKLPMLPEIQAALDRHQPATALPKVQPMPAAPFWTGSSPAKPALQAAREIQELLSTMHLSETPEEFRQDLTVFGMAAMMVRPDPDQGALATQLSIRQIYLRTDQLLEQALLKPIPPDRQDLEMEMRMGVVKAMQANPPQFWERLQILQMVQGHLMPMILQRRQAWRLVFQMHMMKAPWMLVVGQQLTRQEQLLQELTLKITLLVVLASTLLQIKEQWQYWILQRILHLPSNMERRPPFSR